jgi:polyhydroxybutyrate depolymerase
VPLTVAGQSRPFLLFVPEGYDGRHLLPLVLNLHQTGDNGQRQMEISQMAAVADRRGFAVAAPNGAVAQGPDAYAWNVPGVPLLGGTPVPPGTPNDERYLLAVVHEIKKTVCTASKRVYLTGYSGGARMSSQMACDFYAKIAAIAPVSGLRAGVPEQTATGGWKPSAATCRPEEGVPVGAFHGTADPVNPYAGNDDLRWGYGVELALARWARLNRCRRGPKKSGVTASVDLVSYSKCRDTATASLYRQEGAGHTWPGGTGPEIGPIDQSITASLLIWRFFRKHSLAERR